MDTRYPDVFGIPILDAIDYHLADALDEDSETVIGLVEHHTGCLTEQLVLRALYSSSLTLPECPSRDLARHYSSDQYAQLLALSYTVAAMTQVIQHDPTPEWLDRVLVAAGVADWAGYSKLREHIVSIVSSMADPDQVDPVTREMVNYAIRYVLLPAGIALQHEQLVNNLDTAIRIQVHHRLRAIELADSSTNTQV